MFAQSVSVVSEAPRFVLTALEKAGLIRLLGQEQCPRRSKTPSPPKHAGHRGDGRSVTDGSRTATATTRCNC